MHEHYTCHRLYKDAIQMRSGFQRDKRMGNLKPEVNRVIPC